MKHFVIVVLWISVVLAGTFLRFDHLSERPFHADEATGARITASRMTSGDYQFDPVHYHGPLLSGLAIPLCQWFGEDDWHELSKQTLRLGPAIAGTLLLLVPLLLRRRFGDWAMLAASALLATSPLLVYYSRMFIHEMWLTLFGMLALACLIRFPRFGIPGVAIGLMFAVKETFAISIIAWSVAGMVVLLENRGAIVRAFHNSTWKEWRVPVITTVLAAVVVSAFFYTDGFRHPAGVIDSVRTYFVYETVEGHDKPFGYYLELVALPFKSGGVWWFGTPVVILAAMAYLSTFRSDFGARPFIRFIAYSSVGHFLIYSLIGYKTPWLACLPWAHVCLLAGLAFTDFSPYRPLMKAALVLLAAGSLVTQFQQARLATGRFASDARNPFAYVPTRNEIESLPPFLRKLRDAAPSIRTEPVAVIGKDYWPLPWYLRSFPSIGYWDTPPAGLEADAVVLAMPDVAEAVARQLAETHIALPRGLRAAVPMQLFVRNDVWTLWMESD